MQSPFNVISLLLPWDVIPHIKPGVDVSDQEKKGLWRTTVGFRAGVKTCGSVDELYTDKPLIIPLAYEIDYL